ncbi:MAG: hypothetical protein AAF281_16895 [Pseudomonadota bacterium]
MPTLTRQSREGQPPKGQCAGLVIGPGVMLRAGRAHELCGPARHTLALMLARAVAGPLLWIRPLNADGLLSGDGISAWIDPGRLVFAKASRAADVLWSVEEALRSGALPLVIAELAEPPALTPVRRLHLAAEAAPGQPTALLLTPGEGGAQGIETRWHIRPAPGWADRGNAAWTLRRTRARMAPEAAWRMETGPDSTVLSPITPLRAAE